MPVGDYPDWTGAMRYWLRNHGSLLDPVGGGAVTVRANRHSPDDPQDPFPLVVVDSEPGFNNDYVPLSYPRMAIYAYHTTQKNARDLWALVDRLLGPTRHGGSGFRVQMPASLGSDIIRFNNIARASTPFTDDDEGWPMCYVPYVLNIHSEVLA